jgi:hypothetical protein
VHVSTPERRDRLWLINGLAVVLLTLLGAASRAVGYDRETVQNLGGEAHPGGVKHSGTDISMIRPFCSPPRFWTVSARAGTPDLRPD